jgi:hypothetical protein
VPTINKVQTGAVVMAGKPYPIVEQPRSTCDGGLEINARHRPLEQLLSHTCLFGPRCLAFEGFAVPSSTNCGPDRIEVDLANAYDENALRFGETRYLRFFLRVDPAVSNLKNTALISQTWQGSSMALGGRPAVGPAFTIALIYDDRDDELIDLQFRYRNEVSAENPAHFFFQYPVKKGEWHAFHLKLTPRFVGHPDGPGEVLIWVDQPLNAELDPTHAVNYDASDHSSHEFYWGYPPDPETRLGSSFDVRVGIYRPEPLTFLKFWMDGVKLTREKTALAGL